MNRIHPFKTNNNYYVYDSFSNRIFCIQQEAYNMLLLGNDLKRIKSFCTNLRNTSIDFFGENKSEIDLFKYPVETRHYLSIDEILYKLDNEVSQLLIEVSENCNFRCKYCIYSGHYFYERTHSNKQMDWETAQKAIDLFLELSKHQVNPRTISFYGGEPLTNFELIKSCTEYVTRITKNNTIHLTFSTNGYLLTKEKFRFLRDNNFYIYVSLDGPQNIHDRNRNLANSKETFRKVFTNLSALYEFDQDYYRERVFFLCVVSDYNELQELTFFFANNELTMGHLVFANHIGEFDVSEEHPLTKFNTDTYQGEQNRYCDDVAQSKKPITILKSSFDISVRKIFERKIGLQKGYIRPNGICIPGSKKIYVRTNGMLYPCERVGDTFPIGSVDRGLDKNIITKYINDYITMCNQVCLDCWAANFCSACFAHVRAGGYMTLDRKKANCDTIKSEIHNGLVIYSTIMEKQGSALENYFGRNKNGSG